MKDNFELLQYNFEDEISIVPLYDLHIGASNCMLKEIKETIQRIIDKPNCYCVLGGDILDNAVLTGKNLGVFDGCSPKQAIDMAIEILKPLADNNKILCAISGNHEERSEKVTDINPLYIVCCELGIQDAYRPSLGIVKITVGKRSSTDQCYTMLLHHGKGTSESAIKKDHEFINNFEGVDLIVTGHTHNSRVAKFNKYSIDTRNNGVGIREITIIVANSFLKDAEYGIKSMLVGANNTPLSFDLKLQKKKQVVVHY